MHACTIAKELGMTKVLVPFMPGAFSAYGILVSDIRAGYSKSILRPLSGSENLIEEGLADLKEQASGDLKNQGILEKDAIFLPSLDLRYKGQSYEINVDLQEKIQEFISVFGQLE